jgi:hypothetical protein
MSTFLTESADWALLMMVKHVSPARSLSALIQGLDGRHAGIRTQSLRLIVLLYQTRGRELKNLREVDMLLSKLSKLSADQSPDTRAYCRDLVRQLIYSELLTRNDVERFLPKEYVEKALAQSFGSSGAASRICAPSPLSRRRTLSHRSSLPSSVADSDAGVISPRGVVTAVGSPVTRKEINSNDGEEVSKFKKKIPESKQQTYPELVTLQAVVVGLTSKNWQERIANVTALSKLIIDNHELLDDAGKLKRAADSLLDMFEDGSIKVSSTD